MKRIFTTLNILLLGMAMYAQPVFVRDIPKSSSQFTEVGSTLFFTSGDTLWKSNGTTTGTVIVKTGLDEPGSLFENNGLLYFLNNRTGAGPWEYKWKELWVSNGTTSGTFLLRSSDVGEIKILEPIGSTIYFTAHTTSSGRELWKTNGTLAGTQLVKDINPGTASAFSTGINEPVSEVVNNELYFSANDGVHGIELWKTNGTSAGTVLVKDINPGSAQGVQEGFSVSAVANNNLFFVGNDGIHGPELWKSNGSAAGTVLLKDINPSANPTFFTEESGEFIDYFPPHNLTAVGGIVYFVPKESFKDGFEYVHLWKSDGTTAGTVEVKQVPVDNADSFTMINGKLIFVGMFGAGQQIWASDGTNSGTVKIKDNFTGGDNVFEFFIKVNNHLVFTESTQGFGYHLWETDGSTTTLIRKMNSRPGDFEVVNDFLFFTENGTETYYESGDGVNDLELWQSDLTPEGTFMVKNISERSFAFSSNLKEVGGSLFFSTDAFPRRPTAKLWKYTPDPFVVHELTLVNSETDRDIRALKENDTIYTNQHVAIRAKVSGPVGSVRFFVNGVLRRTENEPPYSLSGDAGGDFNEWMKEEGLYTITAIPYSGNNGTGTAGDPFTKHIRVMPFVSYFTLINADSDTAIRDLQENDTIRYTSSTPITIRANPRVAVGSVYFYLDGSFFWRENTAPFALRGDDNGDYAPWTPTYGNHTLTTRAYSGPNGTGSLVETETIHFTVVPAMSAARRMANVSVYPNPAAERIHLSLDQSSDQITEVIIVNSSGEIFYQGANMEAFGSVGVDLSQLDMSTGIYFVKIKTSGQEEQTVKLVKN